VLNLRARVTRSAPCERGVRDRLSRFYDWCAANDDIPELLTLASTISAWENELVRAVLTGVTNARLESLNRIAKLEARWRCGSVAPYCHAANLGRLSTALPGLLIRSHVLGLRPVRPDPFPQVRLHRVSGEDARFRCRPASS
jgi:hypothetical protein